MIILSADTSSDKFSIAVLRGNKTIARFKAVSPNRQSSDMLPEIDRLLTANSLHIKDIGLFCIGLGPGSFTGLRIGITVMRTMALALKRPIVGIPSIDAIAHNVPACKKPICVIIDAKQRKLYVRFYKCRKGVLAPAGRIMLLEMEEFLSRVKSPVFFLGDGIKTYKGIMLKSGFSRESLAPEALWYPEAEIIGMLGVEKMRNRGKDNVFTLSPLYIYPKECQVIKKKKVLSCPSPWFDFAHHRLLGVPR